MENFPRIPKFRLHANKANVMIASQSSQVDNVLAVPRTVDGEEATAPFDGPRTELDGVWPAGWSPRRPTSALLLTADELGNCHRYSRIEVIHPGDVFSVASS